MRVFFVTRRLAPGELAAELDHLLHLLRVETRVSATSDEDEPGRWERVG